MRLPARSSVARALCAACAAALCAVALCSCANTVQDRPIPHNILEGLIEAPFPVYWLGGSFDGMAVSEATHDPSDSYSVQYGDCLVGGQGACVAPLRVVTSPDNSFLPGGSTPSTTTRIRGIDAVLAQEGRTIVMATGGVVVDIYATSARTAAAAARTIVPINALGAPEAPLAPALPDTGFDEAPLPSQVPPPLRPLG
ncbi:MAG: hypothetical protein ACLQBY_15055 [Solirubrobacteraceae bacterium]